MAAEKSVWEQFNDMREEFSKVKAQLNRIEVQLTGRKQTVDQIIDTDKVEQQLEILLYEIGDGRLLERMRIMCGMMGRMSFIQENLVLYFLQKDQCAFRNFMKEVADNETDFVAEFGQFGDKNRGDDQVSGLMNRELIIKNQQEDMNKKSDQTAESRQYLDDLDDLNDFIGI